MKYEKYKDSGIEWIGEIPEDWKCERIKSHFVSPKKIVGNEHEKYDRLALTLSGVMKRDKLDDKGLQPLNFKGYQICIYNDLIFKLIDLENIATSRVGLSSFSGIISPAYILLRNSSYSLDNKFAYYYFFDLWNKNVYKGLGGNGVRSSLNKNDLLNMPIPIPSISEQIQIICYLDNKTLKVDTIIESLEKQREKLETYKREIIAEAVTKGLDKNVDMKDSGVDWITEVPKHWKVLRGKGIFIKQKRPVKDRYETVTCFRDGEVTLRSNRRTDGFTQSLKEIGYQGVAIGDLVIHEMDAFAGAIGVSDSEGKCTPVYSVCKIADSGSEKYFSYLLREMAQRGFIESLGKGIRERTVDFRFNTLVSLYYPVPPKEEQYKIAEYLDNKLEKINFAKNSIDLQIDKLKEYRKIIIHDVVTGKIKVAGGEA